MAALTPTLIQHFNLPTTVDYDGTQRKLVKVYLEATSTAASNTINLATYIPGLSQIINIDEAIDGAQSSTTANTWSTSTITFAGHSGSGVWKMLIGGYY